MKRECDFSSNRFLMWPYEMRNTATMTCSHGQFNSSDWSFCPCAIQLDHSLYKRETLTKREIQKVWEKEILRDWMGGKSDVGSVRWECSTPLKQQGTAKHVHLPPAYASITTIQIQNLLELNQRCNKFQENMSHLKQHAGLGWTTKIQASHCCFN